MERDSYQMSVLWWQGVIECSCGKSRPKYTKQGCKTLSNFQTKQKNKKTKKQKNKKNKKQKKQKTKNKKQKTKNKQQVKPKRKTSEMKLSFNKWPTNQKDWSIFWEQACEKFQADSGLPVAVLILQGQQLMSCGNLASSLANDFLLKKVFKNM